jgi:hypothetical protein
LPAAMASMRTRPNDLYDAGSTRTSRAAMTRGMSGRKPANWSRVTSSRHSRAPPLGRVPPPSEPPRPRPPPPRPRRSGHPAARRRPGRTPARSPRLAHRARSPSPSPPTADPARRPTPPGPPIRRPMARRRRSPPRSRW